MEYAKIKPVVTQNYNLASEILKLQLQALEQAKNSLNDIIYRLNQMQKQILERKDIFDEEYKKIMLLSAKAYKNDKKIYTKGYDPTIKIYGAGQVNFNRNKNARQYYHTHNVLI